MTEYRLVTNFDQQNNVSPSHKITGIFTWEDYIILVVQRGNDTTRTTLVFSELNGSFSCYGPIKSTEIDSYLKRSFPTNMPLSRLGFVVQMGCTPERAAEQVLSAAHLIFK